ncbi:uncharacterized protein LOC110187101 [Drosophila serrata]|uniref:uncharacterized protein LOC110187101 n=1 Tax=Drosophila serrata TaxID=7274 RepID=UPI000A1D08F5|nr:uncharacterized protein LOC110187101 [Drosophila serrata]
MGHSNKARKAAAREANAAAAQRSAAGSQGDTSVPRKAQREQEATSEPQDTAKPRQAQQQDTAEPTKKSQQEDTARPMATGHDQFLESLLQMLYKTWIQLRRLVEFVMSELGGREIVESMAAWCAKNPHIAICLLAAGLVFLLPFLIIFGFGIATMLMTFTGLLVLEGTLLTIVSMVFFACLGGFIIMVPLFGVAAVAAYFGFSQVYGLYDGMERHKINLFKMLREAPSRQRNVTPTPSVAITEEPTSTT